MVIGPNWTLSCDTEALCSRISKEFTGELVVIPA
jgi:hypothetical protein